MGRIKLYLAIFLFTMISFLSFWIASEYNIELDTQRREAEIAENEKIRQLVFQEPIDEGNDFVHPKYDSAYLAPTSEADEDSTNVLPLELEKEELEAAKKAIEEGMLEIFKSGTPKPQVSASSVLAKILPQIIFAFILFLATLLVFIALYRIFKKQEEINLERDYFISSLTHELKTPLSIISVALEAIQNYQKDPEKHKQYITSARGQIKKLNKSIDQILTYNDDSNLNIFIEQLNLNEVIQDVIQDVDKMVVQKNGLIEFDSGVENAMLSIDKHHFTNMLYNIIDNSIKYNEQEPRIFISIHAEDNAYRIRIQDNGIGIDGKNQQHVFDQFYRADKNNKNGHGIGLYYVKKIVDAHDGTIQIESILAKGTTLILKFPKNEKS